MPTEPLNPQPGHLNPPGLRYREGFGGAIAAIQDLIVAGGGVPKTYPSNWAGLIRAIQDLGVHIGNGGTQVIAGLPVPNYVPPIPGSPPGTPGNWGSPANPPQNGTLWYDDRQGRLMVWINGAFYQTNGAESMVHVGPEPPKDFNGDPDLRLGKLWFDTRQGRTFTLIESANGDKEWYQLNGEENQTVFVEPSRRRSYYAVTTGVTFTEDVSAGFGVISDPTGVLGTLSVGDSVRGLTSNGGGIIESVAGTDYTLNSVQYRGALTAGEAIEIGRPHLPGQISSFTPTLISPTYTYDAAAKQLVFSAVPAEINVGDFVTNQAVTNGGQVSRIFDSNADGIPDTVQLGPINFIGDLTDNDPLAIKNAHSQVAKLGDLWFRSDIGDLAIYDSSSWIAIAGDGGGGSQVIIADSAPWNLTGVNLDATYDTPQAVDGTLWFNKQRKTTYVSVDQEWQPITDRKYITMPIQANNAALTPIYETTADKHGFFVDYVVMDDTINPTIVNGGRILVYHVGPHVNITNVMAQGLDATGLNTQMGVKFEGTIDIAANTFTLECVCDNAPGVVLTNPPVIQIAVSNWVDPQ